MNYNQFFKDQDVRREQEMSRETKSGANTLNIVSKSLPRQFRKVAVEQVPGTQEWTKLLRCDEFVTLEGEIIRRREWGW